MGAYVMQLSKNINSRKQENDDSIPCAGNEQLSNGSPSGTILSLDPLNESPRRSTKVSFLMIIPVIRHATRYHNQIQLYILFQSNLQVLGASSKYHCRSRLPAIK